jgi:hypothetical protein
LGDCVVLPQSAIIILKSVMATGYLALVLHAHLPFVRHPEHKEFLEEDWLFEAVTETYLPLIAMMQRLVRDGVPFKLTMTVSPTLCAMLSDQLPRDRYVRYLDQAIDLAAREIERNCEDESLRRLSEFYHANFFDCRFRFLECAGNLLGEFRKLILKPNRQEADTACQRLFGAVDYHALLRHVEAPFLFVTHGEDGVALITADGEQQAPARKVGQPVDICGAGDSFSAGAAVALAVTGSPLEAARFGNLVASITIMKKGTGKFLVNEKPLDEFALAQRSDDDRTRPDSILGVGDLSRLASYGLNVGF